METEQIAAIVVRTEKISVSCRFASAPFDNMAVTAKHQPRRMDMRFISICTVNSTSRLPTEAEMASMHKLIVEGMKAGWLLECEGVTFGTTGVRVHKAASGEVTVTDGPFAETKEVLGGYAILRAASMEEAVEHTRRFLDHVGTGTWEGTWETYQLYEMPAGEPDFAARSWENAVREGQ
jgi:hypothetical protein